MPLFPSSPRHPSLTKVAIVFLHLGVTFAFVGFGAVQWPGLHWDAALFATPVLNVATGEGWVFGGFPSALVSSETRDYLSHGFLHVLVFGSWLQCDTWEKFFWWCGVTNALTFLAWALVFTRSLARVDRGAPFVSLAFGIIAGMIALGLQGRPEHPVPLILAIPLLLREFGFVKERGFDIALYALGGILLCTSPASGVLMGMGVLFRVSLRHEKPPLLRFWKELFLAGLVAAGTALTMIAFLQPASVLSWLRGLTGSASTALDFSDHLFRFHLDALTGITMDAPLWNVTVMASALLAWFVLWRRRRFISAVLLFFAATYCLPRLTDYGYTPFIPIALLYWITRTPSSGLALATSPFRRPLCRTVTILALLYTIAFFRTSALTAIHATTGTRLAETRSKLADLGVGPSRDEGRVVVFHGPSRPSFIVIGDGGDLVIQGSLGDHDGERDPALLDYEKRFGRNIAWFVFPQAHLGPAPEEWFVGSQRCELVFDGWSQEKAPFSFLLRETIPPGYQMAVYAAAAPE